MKLFYFFFLSYCLCRAFTIVVHLRPHLLARVLKSSRVKTINVMECHEVIKICNITSQLVDELIDSLPQQVSLLCSKDGLHVCMLHLNCRICVMPDMIQMPIAYHPHVNFSKPIGINIPPKLFSLRGGRFN